jgi:hypothetical protein
MRVRGDSEGLSDGEELANKSLLLKINFYQKFGFLPNNGFFNNF